MTTRRSHLDQRFLRYPVRAVVNGVEHDPTNDTVVFAFPLRGAQPVTFISGSWETDADGDHYARVLVGPSAAFVPAANTLYDVWIKVTDNPEIPVEKIDLLVIT